MSGKEKKPKYEAPSASLPRSGEEGIALLIALIGLSLFSLLGMYMVINGATELRISDNQESAVGARYAAMAGLNHAREVLRGLSFNDLLKGPDGTNNAAPAYITQARTFGFRNPVSWDLARSLNMLDPTNDLVGIADDGLLNTGKYGATNGTVLIPITGIAQTAPNPYGGGNITTARYFVKNSDNNGEASELAKDPSNDPFVDGDGIIIVRSMGVGQTLREVAGGVVRRNSVAVFESRFEHRSTFDLASPLVVQGNNISASFAGNAFGISGGSAAGIGVIDTNPGDGIHPDQILRNATGGKGSITGGGLPNPSIQDITASVSANPAQAMLLNPTYLYNFVNNIVPTFANNIYNGDQHWSGGSAPYIGSYDPTQAYNAPGQDPKVTIVRGNLDVAGNFTGGGLLVVTGDFSCNGRFTYNGLVLVVGTGNVSAGGLNRGIYGGMYVVKVVNNAGNITFGEANFSMNGNSNIYANSNAMSMAISLMPPIQLTFREITSTIDP